MRELSRRSGVAVSFLSRLGAGGATTTLATLRKVLLALGTDLGPFFAEHLPAPRGCVIRRKCWTRNSSPGRSPPSSPSPATSPATSWRGNCFAQLQFFLAVRTTLEVGVTDGRFVGYDPGLRLLTLSG